MYIFVRFEMLESSPELKHNWATLKSIPDRNKKIQASANSWPKAEAIDPAAG